MAKTNFHESFQEKGETKLGSNRNFGLVVGIAFAFIGALLVHKGNNVIGFALAGGGILLALAGLFCAERLTALNRLWAKFGLLLHHIVSPLIMFFLFFATVLPIGILMRLFGADPLRKRHDTKATSYWIERTSQHATPASLKRQF